MSESILLKVMGMKCGGCEANLKQQLLSLDGIITVEASHTHNEVNINVNPKKITVNTLTEVITSAGYQVVSP